MTKRELVARDWGGGELAVEWHHGTRARPGYRLVIELPRSAVPSLAGAQKRIHWTRASRAADHWRHLLCAVVRRNMRPRKPLTHARIVCTRRSAVEPDPENLAYSFKPVIDALCRSEWRTIRRAREGWPARRRYIARAEILEDDAPSILERDYRWEQAPPGQSSARIEVMEVLCNGRDA